MKVVLFDIENHFSSPEMEDAMELVKNTREYDLSQPQEGHFYCLSKGPDYHVEMTLKPAGYVYAKCHCPVYKRSKRCAHAIASLLLLRDHLLRSRKSKSRLKSEHYPLQDVLQKLKVSDLRSFIASFAISHNSFRAEFLATHMHVLKKPDYHGLLMEITPMDKYGRIRLNRNNLKTVRNILSLLLQQAQDHLRDKALDSAFQILEATIHHLYRLLIKVPQFEEQITAELKLSIRLFDVFCHQQMAPRLQQQAIALAMDVSHRDGYFHLKGTQPLLRSVEPFLLESKIRQEAFQIGVHKIQSATSQTHMWAGLLIRWSRLWSLEIRPKAVVSKIIRELPELIQEYYRQGQFEDVVYAYNHFMHEDHTPAMKYSMGMAAMKSARQTGNHKLVSSLGSDMSIHFLDTDAWDLLYEADAENGMRILRLIDSYYTPGADSKADLFLLHGFSRVGDVQALLGQLKILRNIEYTRSYDEQIIELHPGPLADLYVDHILSIKEAYGGAMARQKLSNIFAHLKSINLYSPVVEKVKHMENKKTETPNGSDTPIRGFVFDLDGVIVDTAEHHFKAWTKIMHQLGAEISPEDDQHTRGASRMESFEYLLKRYGISLSQEEKVTWAAHKNELYLASIQQLTPQDILPGAFQFLIESKKKGLAIALGSASKNARLVLHKLDIEDRFDAILDGTDTTASKPDPEIFLKACKALHLDPAEVVVFEDAAKGVQAAIAAGCRVVGIGDPASLRDAALVISGLDQSTPSQIMEQLS